jgi:hypothetical protein
MTLRHGGVDVASDRATLRRLFPTATPRVAVFLHGLCETEHAWSASERKQRQHDACRFGDRLADLGFTPLYVRYNSGLHIADNGVGSACCLSS